MEPLTKKKLECNAKNLNDFDAVLFYTSGTPAMDEQRLDSSMLELNNPKVHRKDRDFAVSWAKMYGKGRVFYSTLGHVEATWDMPELQKMYLEAIKWALRLVDADVTPRPAAVPQ